MNTLPLDLLQRKVDEGAIDTVLATFPDLQGRLAGKRYTGRTFLTQAVHGWEGCDYLLGCDIENDPLPGYTAFSWEQGRC
jgi:glutamine synthetase